MRNEKCPAYLYLITQAYPQGSLPQESKGRNRHDELGTACLTSASRSNMGFGSGDIVRGERKKRTLLDTYEGSGHGDDVDEGLKAGGETFKIFLYCSY